MVAVVAHCPALGVKVYVPEAVLLTVAGDQVPGTEFDDVVGNVGAVVPAQKAAIWVNEGVTLLFTVSVAAFEFTLPDALVPTQRYW